MNNEMTTDNMSNEEVIEVLKGIVFNGFDRTTRKERQALHLAIKALEEQAKKGDCISREALKNAFWGTDDGKAYFLSEIYSKIDNAPTVEQSNYAMGYQDGVRKVLKEVAEGKHRPQGEWIIIKSPLSNETIVKCDKCGDEFIGNDVEDYNFCPNCGADMREGDAE